MMFDCCAWIDDVSTVSGPLARRLYVYRGCLLCITCKYRRNARQEAQFLLYPTSSGQATFVPQPDPKAHQPLPTVSGWFFTIIWRQVRRFLACRTSTDTSVTFDSVNLRTEPDNSKHWSCVISRHRGALGNDRCRTTVNLRAGFPCTVKWCRIPLDRPLCSGCGTCNSHFAYHRRILLYRL